jgi:hypothetical protein
MGNFNRSEWEDALAALKDKAHDRRVDREAHGATRKERVRVLHR